MSHITLTEDQWVEQFKPVQHFSPADQHTWNGWLIHEDLDDPRLDEANPDCIWTLLDVDGEQVIASGRHFINREGYFITEHPVPTDTTIDVEIDNG